MQMSRRNFLLEEQREKTQDVEDVNSRLNVSVNNPEMPQLVKSVTRAHVFRPSYRPTSCSLTDLNSVPGVISA